MGAKKEIATLRADLSSTQKKLGALQKSAQKSRKRIKDLAGGIEQQLTARDFFYVAFNEIYTLLLNAVKISNVTYRQETFIKHALFEQGQVGYRRNPVLWANISGQDVDAYGFPVRATFTTANGTPFNVELSYDQAGTNYIILANEQVYPLVTSIWTTCEVLAQLDVSIHQNAKAVRVPRLIAAPDGDEAEDLKLSLLYANSQIEEGVPVVKVNEMLGKSLQNIDLRVDLIADRILLVKTEIRNQLLTRIGVLTANSDKKERVQVGEVQAHVGECVDSIYTIIDSFNRQCKDYGIDSKMELNCVLEDLYTPQQQEQQQENKTQEDAEQ